MLLIFRYLPSKTLHRAATLLPLLLLMPACSDSSSISGGGGGSGGAGGSATLGEPDDWQELLAPVAGSRLRPVFRVAEDGTKVHVGWHDTLLDTPCKFNLTPNAGLRCLPTDAGTEPNYFADANCTEPVLQDSRFAEDATVVFARGDSCFEQTYYEIGEPVDEIYYFSDISNTTCAFHSNTPSHRVTVIAHEQFVEANVTAQDGDNRIVPMLLEASDGSRQIFGAYDRVHEERVEPAVDTLGQMRWFGSGEPQVSAHYFADSACTEPLALATCIPDGQEPTTAREMEPGHCGALVGRRALLEEVTQVYTLSNNSGCQPGGLNFGYSPRVWRLGAPLDDTAFAAAPAINDGGLRLRHDIYASAEGAPFLASQRYYDLALSVAECSFNNPATNKKTPLSGPFECIPHGGVRIDERYADAACTQPTAARYVSEQDCPIEASFAYKTGTVAPLLGASGPGNYRRDEQNNCVMDPWEEPDGTFGEYEFYLVDEASALESAQADDVIE